MRLPPNRLMQSLTNQTKPNASALNTLAIEQHPSQTPPVRQSRCWQGTYALAPTRITSERQSEN